MKSEVLKKWRKISGYTQGEFADILGVALNTVSRWEIGEREIPPFLHITLKAIPKKGGSRKKTNTKKRKEATNGTKRNL